MSAEQKTNRRARLRCVYWDTASLTYSDAGCTLTGTSETTATCSCNHLTQITVVDDSTVSPGSPPPAAGPSTTETANPKPPTYTHQVQLQVKLPYSKQTFDTAKQLAFRKSVAEAASVGTADVTISKIADARRAGLVSARRAGAVLVDVSVKTLSLASANAVASSLSADRLNAKLKTNGLQEGVVVTAPSVSSLASPSSLVAPSASKTSSIPIPAIAGGAAAVLLVAGIVFGWMRFSRNKNSPKALLPMTEPNVPPIEARSEATDDTLKDHGVLPAGKLQEEEEEARAMQAGWGGKVEGEMTPPPLPRASSLPEEAEDVASSLPEEAEDVSWTTVPQFCTTCRAAWTGTDLCSKCGNRFLTVCVLPDPGEESDAQGGADLHDLPGAQMTSMPNRRINAREHVSPSASKTGLQQLRARPRMVQESYCLPNAVAEDVHCGSGSPAAPDFSLGSKAKHVPKAVEGLMPTDAQGKELLQTLVKQRIPKEVLPRAPPAPAGR